MTIVVDSVTGIPRNSAASTSGECTLVMAALVFLNQRVRQIAPYRRMSSRIRMPTPRWDSTILRSPVWQLLLETRERCSHHDMKLCKFHDMQ